jgi:hypothetical protein
MSIRGPFFPKHPFISKNAQLSFPAYIIVHFLMIRRDYFCAMISTYLAPPFFLPLAVPFLAAGAPNRSSIELAVLMPVLGLLGGPVPATSGGRVSTGGLIASSPLAMPGVEARLRGGTPIGGGIEELR